MMIGNLPALAISMALMAAPVAQDAEASIPGNVVAEVDDESTATDAGSTDTPEETAAPQVVAMNTKAPSGAVKVDIAEEEEKPSYAWGGSSIGYNNSVSLPSLVPGYFDGQVAEVNPSCEGKGCGRHNPNYSMTLSFNPSWAVSDWMTLGGSFSLTGELTQSDSYPDGYPVQWSDLSLSASFPGLYTIEAVDVGISASAGLSFGTSLYSLSTAKILGTRAGLKFSRKFQLLNGLSVGMGLSGGGNFHSRGGGAYTQAIRMDCRAGTIENLDGDCEDMLLTGGSRTVLAKVRNSYSASLQVLEWLGVSTNIGFGWGMLDSLSDAVASPDSSASDHGLQTDLTNTASVASWGVQDSTSTRYYVSHGVSVNATLPQLPYLTFVLGESMSHGQLGTDGQRISFDQILKTTTFYLDVSFNLGSFVAEL